MSDFGFYTATELLTRQFESREPLIDQMLYERDSVILAGKPKIGKSIFLFQLICALTSGEPFLDRFEVKKKCRVLYIQLEGSLSDSKDRFNRMIKALALMQDNFYVLFSPPLPLNDETTMIKLIKDIKSKMGEVDVVIIDPIYFAMKGSLSDDEAVRDFTGQLRIMQESLECACILTHHFKKARRDQAGNILTPDDDDVFGSVFFQAWITHQFLFDMDRSSKARTLQCNVQRSGKIVDKVNLKMIEPEPLYFEEIGHWPTKPESIVKFYSQFPGKLFTAKETYSRIDMPKSSFYKAIKTVLMQKYFQTGIKDSERAYGYFPECSTETANAQSH